MGSIGDSCESRDDRGLLVHVALFHVAWFEVCGVGVVDVLKQGGKSPRASSRGESGSPLGCTAPSDCSRSFKYLSRRLFDG